MGVVLIDVFLMHSGFGAKFTLQKFSSISPCFRGKNLVVLHLSCIIAHKTLFSPSFWCENMAIKVPHFHDENSAKFLVWCTMVCIDMLILRRAEALQSIKHVNAHRLHRETNVSQVTWIGTTTPRWPCTQYTINIPTVMPWAHTHTIRPGVLMVSEGRSHYHKS